jgi:chromosome segregation ATPase
LQAREAGAQQADQRATEAGAAVTALQQQVDDLNHRLATSETLAAERETARDQVAKELAETLEQLDAAQRAAADQNAELAEARTKVSELQSGSEGIAELQAQRDGLRAQLEQAQRAWEAQVEELRAHLAAAEKLAFDREVAATEAARQLAEAQARMSEAPLLSRNAGQKPRRDPARVNGQRKRPAGVSARVKAKAKASPPKKKGRAPRRR